MTFDVQPSEYDTYHESYAGLPVFRVLWAEHGRAAGGRRSRRLEARGQRRRRRPPHAPLRNFRLVFDNVDTAKVRAIVVGEWPDSYEVSSEPIVGRLTGSAGRLPELRSLFVGATIPDHCEISWIQQSDVTPLLAAFPRLERLEVRGGTGLLFPPVRHEALRVLRLETGGLPAAVIRGVGGSDLPALDHLELWFGVNGYGGDSTVTDVAGILSGAGLPALRHLGLQNCPFADELAAAVAVAPVVARLESLSLSMGTFGDEGAEALLTGHPLTHLRRLDLRRNYLSDTMLERLHKELPGVEILADDRRSHDEDWRYVAVTE